MTVPHELRYYTRPDGVNIAYSYAGSGPPLLVVPGWTTHLNYFWEEPISLLFGPLTDFVTVITYDKHGCGLSDRDRTVFTMETERYDVEALVDHLGLESFDLMGISEGGTVAADFAAVHPGRVDRLVLYACTAYGAGLAPEDFRKSFVEIIRASWGVGSNVMTNMLMPGASTAEREAFARWQRDSASAEVAAATMEMLYGWDIRSELADISAPTLILHRRDSRAFPPENGRTLAAGIPDARAMIIDGVQHMPPVPGDPHTIDVINEILGFVAGGARVLAPADKPRFRTILFTDIEGSTELVERLGDADARTAMREHDAIVRSAVTAHGGTVVKETGDGVMATFPSASGAIDAAIAMQRKLDERTSTSETPIGVRIGIHAGEPIEEGDDLHGSSVIKAARIMGAADGGQILASSIVRGLVAGRDYAFSDRGSEQLKGLAEPLHLYEVDWSLGSAT
jgi:class 3 adenylate cyclase/pimeloyl-ACP methyl ester carboxylesterase